MDVLMTSTSPHAPGKCQCQGCNAAYRSCCVSVQYWPPDLAALDDVPGGAGISNQAGWSCGQDSAPPMRDRPACATLGGPCETNTTNTLQDKHSSARSCSATLLPFVTLSLSFNSSQGSHYLASIEHQHKQAARVGAAHCLAVNAGTLAAPLNIDVLTAFIAACEQHTTWRRPVVQCCSWCVTTVAAQRRPPVHMRNGWAAGRCTAARASHSRLQPAIHHQGIPLASVHVSSIAARICLAC
jgi:hypothetical protein